MFRHGLAWHQKMPKKSSLQQLQTWYESYMQVFEKARFLGDLDYNILWLFNRIYIHNIHFLYILAYSILISWGKEYVKKYNNNIIALHSMFAGGHKLINFPILVVISSLKIWNSDNIWLCLCCHLPFCLLWSRNQPIRTLEKLTWLIC